MADASFMWIKAGEQRSTAGAAARVIVELREADSICGEAIEIWILDFAAVTAEVREAHVIRKDDHDVRPFGARSRKRKSRQNGEAIQRKLFHMLANHSCIRLAEYCNFVFALRRV